MTAHTIQFNIRVTEEEDLLLDQLYLHAMSKRTTLITRTAFLREQLMKLCKKLPKAAPENTE